jgi:hypothetical protein
VFKRDVASLSTRRCLDNEIARAIVSADAVDSRHVGDTGWRPPRTAKMLPLRWDGVGTRAMKISGSAMARGPASDEPVSHPLCTACSSARVKPVTSSPSRWSKRCSRTLARWTGVACS